MGSFLLLLVLLLVLVVVASVRCRRIRHALPAVERAVRPSFAVSRRCLAYTIFPCSLLPSVNAVMLDGSIIDALERKWLDSLRCRAAGYECQKEGIRCMNGIQFGFSLKCFWKFQKINSQNPCSIPWCGLLDQELGPTWQMMCDSSFIASQQGR